MWHNFLSSGAHHLVVTGTVATPEHVAPYRKSLHPTGFTLVRLDATPHALTSRLADRAAGSGPSIPGDTLKGCTPSELRDATELALHEAAALQASRIDDLALDTSNLSAAHAANALFQMLYAEPH
jgi:hypothetical protein